MKQLIILLFIPMVLLSCSENAEVCIYGTEEFNEKEKHFKISLKEASDIFSEFILKNKKENEELLCSLDIIYGDFYIFKEKWEPYNLKLGDYNLSGVWINGNTGEVNRVETDKKIFDYPFSLIFL